MHSKDDYKGVTKCKYVIFTGAREYMSDTSNFKLKLFIFDKKIAKLIHLH